MKNLLFSLNLIEGFHMKKYLVYLIMLSTSLLVYDGCKAINDPEVEQYALKITDAWSAFSQGNFTTATNLFLEAKLSDSSKTDAYQGLAWCYLKLDSLNASLEEFNNASRMGVLNADFHAGLAFVLNASKQYQLSNSNAESALALSPNWVFPYQTSINKSDLQLLAAQNFYQLGNFTNSLTYVKMLNVSFSADVGTATGRLALVNEIERLKNTI